MSYGLCAWGHANGNFIEKIFILQKKAVRAITFSDYRAHSIPIFKDLGILPIRDLFEYKISSLMWDFDHNSLPPAVSVLFTQINNHHAHQTRAATSGRLHIAATKTKQFGKKSFKFLGANTLNKMKNNAIYINSRTKQTFLNKLKISLLDK